MQRKFTKEQRAKAEALRPYENKWVALVNDEVVASGNTPKEVKTEAERKGYKEFVYHLVPSFSQQYIFSL